LIGLRSRRQFLLHCKHNNIFPSHLLHIDVNRFRVTHFKSKLKLERALHSFREVILNTEIFDLSRTITFLTDKLYKVSKILSDSFPTFIWNSIIKRYFPSFNNSQFKMFSFYKKKFHRLLRAAKLSKAKKIKPIGFSCLVNEVNSKKKIIKSHPKNPVPSVNETLVQTSIDPVEFLDFSIDPVNTTNDKWFINLSDSCIPSEVMKLLQLGYKFSLPATMNKKAAIHEIIKMK